MVSIRGGEEKIVEEAIPIENVDPTVCTEKLKGDVDDYGRCVIRLKLKGDEPDRAELLRLKFAGASKGPSRQPPSPAPTEK